MITITTLKETTDCILAFGTAGWERCGNRIQLSNLTEYQINTIEFESDLLFAANIFLKLEVASE